LIVKFNLPPFVVIQIQIQDVLSLVNKYHMTSISKDICKYSSKSCFFYHIFSIFCTWVKWDCYLLLW